MRHLLLFLCSIITTSLFAQIEISVSSNRITLLNYATGEAFQSYDTDSGYNQLPEALNNVYQWEQVDGDPYSMSVISIVWEGFSVISLNAVPCFAGEIFGDGCVCDVNTSFISALSSLNGEYQQNSNGSIILFSTEFDDTESSVINISPDTDVDLCAQGEVSVSAVNNRIVLTNTTTGESIQSYDTDSGYNQLPEALNNVNKWEGINGEEVNIFIIWDGFSIVQVALQYCYFNLDSSLDCFAHNLTSLSGAFTTELDGSFLLGTSCDIPDGACDCEGNILDECGVCGGDNSTCTDCAGVVNGETVEDCAGVCGGTSVIDECGVCGGGGIADGACDCDGNVLDECGVCAGGNSSCSGCTNDNATNYDSAATIDDGSCMYDQEVYDVALALCPECINEDQIDEGFSCTEIWEPVCGCNDVTYSNDCYAFYNGVTEWTDGECELLNPYNPDFDNDDIIGVNDLLALLSVFGSSFVSDADCGNGIVEDGECCDDGNDIQTDGCNACQCEGSPQDE